MNFRARGLFALILATFFVSGVAGLVYQVVWTRYLALFLGHTSYAVIAVLAAFMGGLALGNAWLGSVVDRLPRPLLFYAGLELGIGVFAVLFPFYYDLVHSAFLGLVRMWSPTGLFRLAIQFFFASITILLPTVLMGATLPALTRYVTRSLAELRGKVAALYAINSSGAVAGVILADWWWIPNLGLEVTLYLGAAMSLIVGLIALGASRATQEGFPTAPATTPPLRIETVEEFTPRQLRLALVAISVSGFVAMLYEVAWTRLLALALGSSTHAYSLMLATFISGIATGGWLVYRWKRQAHTLTAFGLAELALAGTLFASLWFYDLLPWWFARLAGLLNRSQAAYPLYELMQALVCFGVMFIPAVCLGTTLPLASRVATAELARTGRSVGRVFAVNTLGTVLGAILTGLYFLPAFGLAHTFVLGIALNALIGLAVLFGAGRRDWRPWTAAAVVLIAGFWSASVLGPRWQRAFALGLWRAKTPPTTLAQYRAQVDSVDLRYHRDGAGSTVAIMAAPLADGRENLMLRVNGKTDATSVGDLATQALLAHVPLVLKPESSEVLIVGLGSGMTVGSALRHSGVQRVDVVEISPEVAEATRKFFNPFNDRALDDPRTVLTLEDAKTFLQTTRRQYDVIITEPSNPWMAGVAAVFSHEFYLNVRDRLKPGGLAAQWLQVYETDDRTVDLVVNTFSSVFPYVGIWQPGGRDLVLVGSVQPFKPDLASIARRFNDPLVRGDMERIGVRDLTSFLNLELIPFGEGLFVPDPSTPVHSDFRPVLEYAAQRAFFSREEADKIFLISEGRNPRPRGLIGPHLTSRRMTTNELRGAAELFRASSLPDPEVFRSQLRLWLETEPGQPEPARLLAALERSLASPDASALVEIGLPGRPEAIARGDVSMLRPLSTALMNSYRARRSAHYLPPSDDLELTLRRLIELDTQNRRVHRARLAEVLWDRGDEPQFFAMALKAFATDSTDNGPYDFSLDQRAPRLVIARMLLTLEQREDWKTAHQLIQEAVRREFVGEDSAVREPFLEHHARRILPKAAPPGSLDAEQP
ncbi:MAG: fused MFS/spermidine synthase [Verrucomicrobia bacterium]|nr:fused MFS/spermidine synthase [Verrucomicrobiota bacterium]